jgi:hypothetical protein
LRSRRSKGGSLRPPPQLRPTHGPLLQVIGSLCMYYTLAAARQRRPSQIPRCWRSHEREPVLSARLFARTRSVSAPFRANPFCLRAFSREPVLSARFSREPVLSTRPFRANPFCQRAFPREPVLSVQFRSGTPRAPVLSVSSVLERLAHQTALAPRASVLFCLFCLCYSSAPHAPVLFWCTSPVCISSGAARLRTSDKQQRAVNDEDLNK